jgi:hypothetical protein
MFISEHFHGFDFIHQYMHTHIGLESLYIHTYVNSCMHSYIHMYTCIHAYTHWA